MNIADLDIENFKKKLRENLTSAKPIRNPQYLRGRAGKLSQIERAFNSPGKHIFIYGDRGVGKTSLAQSAAVIHQSADNDPILIACDQTATFFRLMRDLAARCLPPRDYIEKRKKTESLKLNIPGITLEVGNSIEKGSIPSFETINDAISVISYVSKLHSREPVVIIDEFDQINSPEERKRFADLIKQISDQDVNIRLIFCGIGSSLDDLIGLHMSTGRYLAPIELERLRHDACWEILTSAAQDFNVNIPHEFLVRAGQISDGYPYYVHLIGEMILWSMYSDRSRPATCESRHFQEGVKNAISEAEPVLKITYDKATQKYSDDYQEVLWAVADKVLLRRQITDIYENSYIPIMKKRPNRKLLDKGKFNQRLLNLKGERHGNIIEAKGAGWYQFRENVVRGYVRLRAEEQGIELGKDHH